jgi:hypothetical protein
MGHLSTKEALKHGKTEGHKGAMTRTQWLPSAAFCYYLKPYRGSELAGDAAADRVRLAWRLLA